jgi:hypothetical protein
MFTFLVDEAQAEFMSGKTVTIVHQSKSVLVDHKAVKRTKWLRGLKSGSQGLETTDDDHLVPRLENAERESFGDLYEK